MILAHPRVRYTSDTKHSTGPNGYPISSYVSHGNLYFPYQLIPTLCKILVSLTISTGWHWVWWGQLNAKWCSHFASVIDLTKLAAIINSFSIYFQFYLRESIVFIVISLAIVKNSSFAFSIYLFSSFESVFTVKFIFYFFNILHWDFLLSMSCECLCSCSALKLGDIGSVSWFDFGRS